MEKGIMHDSIEDSISRRKGKRPPPPITLPTAKLYAPIVSLQSDGAPRSVSEGKQLEESKSQGNLRVDESKRFDKAIHHSEEEESEEEESEEDVGDEKEQSGKKSEKGCRCGRTKCLKQYCACFRNDKRCNSDCVCQDCRNDGLHESERMLAVRHVRMHSNTAFKGTRLAPTGQEIVTPRGTVRILRGCRCKKSRCQKKYCECFGAGLACSISCVCIDCINGNDSSQFFDFVAGGGSLSDAPAPAAAAAEHQRARRGAAERGAQAAAAAARADADSPDGGDGDDSSRQASPSGGDESDAGSAAAAESAAGSDSDSDASSPPDAAADGDADGGDPRGAGGEGGDLTGDEYDEKENPRSSARRGAAGAAAAGGLSPTPSTCGSLEDEDTVEATPRGLREIHNLMPCGADKATPVQCRTGWEADENVCEYVMDPSVQPFLGPPAYSPRGPAGRLRWCAWGGGGDAGGGNGGGGGVGMCSPRSPVVPGGVGGGGWRGRAAGGSSARDVGGGAAAVYSVPVFPYG